MMGVDARTQHNLIDQLFSVPKRVRLAKISERSYELLTNILRAIPKRSTDDLRVVKGENLIKLREGNVSDFQ